MADSLALSRLERMAGDSGKGHWFVEEMQGEGRLACPHLKALLLNVEVGVRSLALTESQPSMQLTSVTQHRGGRAGQTPGAHQAASPAKSVGSRFSKRSCLKN